MILLWAPCCLLASGRRRCLTYLHHTCSFQSQDLHFNNAPDESGSPPASVVPFFSRRRHEPLLWSRRSENGDNSEEIMRTVSACVYVCGGYYLWNYTVRLMTRDTEDENSSQTSQSSSNFFEQKCSYSANIMGASPTAAEGTAAVMRNITALSPCRPRCASLVAAPSLD